MNLMAASNWAIYHSAKCHLADGSIDLGVDTLMISLFTSDSNAADLMLSTIVDITHEVQGGGYTPQPVITTWGQDASAHEMRLAANAVTWLATGGDINAVKYAVVWKLVRATDGGGCGACDRDRRAGGYL